MNNEEIINSNKLIAEFMTGEKYNTFYLPEFGHYFYSYGSIEYTETFSIDELKYHSSWGWLMPVVEKISNIVGFKGMDECNETEWYILKRLFDLRISANITSVWIAVIEFIKWYNENKKE